MVFLHKIQEEKVQTTISKLFVMKLLLSVYFGFELFSKSILVLTVEISQINDVRAIYIGFTAHVPPLGTLGLAGEPANFEKWTNGVSVFVLKWLKKRRPGQPLATPRPSFLSTV